MVIVLSPTNGVNTFPKHSVFQSASNITPHPVFQHEYYHRNIYLFLPPFWVTWWDDIKYLYHFILYHSIYKHKYHKTSLLFQSLIVHNVHCLHYKCKSAKRKNRKTLHCFEKGCLPPCLSSQRRSYNHEIHPLALLARCHSKWN